LRVRAYCHACGQAGHIHRTLAAWWHDLAHGVLHLDGKIWRTLPLLALRPGELTRRYVEGERARFVSPLALFLFSVFLMFAIFSAISAPLLGGGASPEAVKEMAAQVEEADRKIDRLEAERERAVKAGQNSAAIDAQLDEARRERDIVAAGEKYLGGADGEGLNIHTGWARLDKGLEKAQKNPALLFYKLQANAYKFSWALIPLSTPFLWLLFLHRRRYRDYKVYDHVVFVTYSIAFMSLLLIALVVLSAIGISGGWLVLLAMIGAPLHIYRQLKGAYQLNRFSALWRTAALIFFALVAINLFLLLLLALGVLA
jgi:outer membrane murein-binding lipoprotein Lpp